MLVEDGLVVGDETVSRMAIDFLRPLLLSNRPVQIRSSRKGDELTQEIRSKGSDALYARVVTTLGQPRQLVPHSNAGRALPSRARRSDLDPSGAVSTSKMFELFQEARILFIAGLLPDMSPGRFVVGRVDVSYGQPMGWRLEPYQSHSWISRIGNSSVTIESQLVDDATVLAQCVAVLVGFDLETQQSRRLSETEKRQLSQPD
jgi:acyl-CoA thioester hydrolase